MQLELNYTTASNKYILVNNTIKKYCVIDIMYKDRASIEDTLNLKVKHVYANMAEFKKVHKGYK